jgi:hypothetical protein
MSCVIAVLLLMTVDTQHGPRHVGGEAETAPAFGYYDAVGWIVRLVTHLDGKVCAYVPNHLGQRRYILCCFVTNAADAVVVDDQPWDRYIVPAEFLFHGSLRNAAVGYAPDRREVNAAGVLPFFFSRLRLAHQIPRDACGRCRDRDGCRRIPRSTERKR